MFVRISAMPFCMAEYQLNLPAVRGRLGVECFSWTVDRGPWTVGRGHCFTLRQPGTVAKMSHFADCDIFVTPCGIRATAQGPFPNRG